MARIVKVDGDYKVSVTAGNTITLDTGPVLGKTIVTVSDDLSRVQ